MFAPQEERKNYRTTEEMNSNSNETKQTIQIVLAGWLLGNFRPWFCIAVKIFANTILATNPIPYFCVYVHRMFGLFVSFFLLLGVSYTLTGICVCEIVERTRTRSMYSHCISITFSFFGRKSDGKSFFGCCCFLVCL